MLPFTLKSLKVCLYVLFGIFTFTGCAPYFHQPLSTSKARLGAEAPTFEQLKKLPAPQQKVVAAVYKFRDQTGQYKPTVNGSSFSTAVTQGATSILLRALEESGWFTAIERENLGNLLNERKIIRSSRAEYAEQTRTRPQMMPPLLFAGVVLEGGIISYDANMLTGGAGLKYFGAGASGQYREDRVTIYLRAISTTNGKILKTVYTSKTVLSQQVDVGIFRFVKLKRLLEAETGFTYNEPSEMAVKEAIEKAVETLVIEGVIEGLWSFNNKGTQNTGGVNDSINPAVSQEVINQEVIKRYLEEKTENSFTDELGRYLVDRRSRFSISANVGGVQYAGDYANPQTRPAGELLLNLNSKKHLAGFLKGGFGQIEARNIFTENFYTGEAGLLYRV
ncbi:MAG TPA: CsgG/HfaB family protein, partial [Adhaeribacter sp.]|nr:CsgG/HfaB family protein [Adhaeribacter sp.]